jgi:hypothetical protein
MVNNDDPKINQYIEGMSLLENPMTFNLKDSKFSVGFAIFDMVKLKFIPRNDLTELLQARAELGTVIDYKVLLNPTHPCNASSGDFEYIDLNSNINKFKQRELIDASMCFDITDATLK